MSVEVISDDIFRPSVSEAICFHPILIILLPCLVNLYPFLEDTEKQQINPKSLHHNKAIWIFHGSYILLS